MVLSIMLGIVSFGTLFTALKEKKVPAERFVGFEVLFIFGGLLSCFRDLEKPLLR